jgi:hypothetical protein
MWRSWRALVLLAAMVGAVVGCGGGSGEDVGAGEELTVRLAEQNGSGQPGTATFIPVDGDRTRIVLELTNPPGVPQPAHVHYGSCDDLGDPLVTLTSVEDGRSETEAEMSLERLAQGDLLIHAHKSDAEYDVSVACAPIGREGGRIDY